MRYDARAGQPSGEPSAMVESASPASLGRVVITEPFDERGVAVLRDAGAEVTSMIGASREALHAALATARGLIVRSETRVDAELLRFGPNLEVVARAGVGVDAIDVDAASAAGIVVVNTPGANTIAATEQTFALLFAALRHTPQAHASVHAGRWERKPFIGHELFGKTRGIIGLGRIGSSVATRAQAFGATVLAFDPFVPASRANALGVELVAFEELLERSHIVTLHVPLTSQTRDMMDARAISLLRPDAVLINCSRGGVVEAQALLDAVQSERIRAVAIDVVPVEPPPPGSASAALLAHPSVIATPHLGGSTFEALERIALELAHDVVRVLGGRPAGGAVNAPSLTGSDAEQAGYVDLAFRMGALLPQLFDEALRNELAIVLQGDLEAVDAEPFVAAVLAGALPFASDRRISMVNALAVARELGVRTVVSTAPAHPPFSSSVTLAAGRHRIVGTLMTTGARIVEIDGFELDAVAAGAMIVTRHRDVPGMVGRIGTLLGDAQVNISTMQVARTTRGGEAMMLLEVDRDIPRPVVDAIAGVEGIAAVRIARL